MKAILRQPSIYRTWQAPFAAQKVAPFLRRNIPRAYERTIDIGCGPGTNSRLFDPVGYLGVDLSPAYVSSARAKHPGFDFRVWDVTTPAPPNVDLFDLAFINSVFHHLSDEGSNRLLSSLPSLLRPQAKVAIIDLVQPTKVGIARLLAKLDRGDFPRGLIRWRELFGGHLQISVLEQFHVGIPGLALWQLVYCEGTLH